MFKYYYLTISLKTGRLGEFLIILDFGNLLAMARIYLKLGGYQSINSKNIPLYLNCKTNISSLTGRLSARKGNSQTTSQVKTKATMMGTTILRSTNSCSQNIV